MLANQNENELWSKRHKASIKTAYFHLYFSFRYEFVSTSATETDLNRKYRELRLHHVVCLFASGIERLASMVYLFRVIDSS